MNEVKNPKKPLVYYYAIVILVILALNFLAVPWLSQRQVKEVDYGTFMTMTENQEIGRVEVQNNQILFTNKDDTQVYKTGLMDDPDLIYRLKDSGAEFSSEIVEQMSPFLSFLLTWLLPIVFFVALGQFMLKRMTNKAGGPNSMMFGLGGSNAKVYVKSAEGIKFSDVAGEDEAKENLTEIVNYQKSKTILAVFFQKFIHLLHRFCKNGHLRQIDNTEMIRICPVKSAAMYQKHMFFTQKV